MNSLKEPRYRWYLLGAVLLTISLVLRLSTTEPPDRTPLSADEIPAVAAAQDPFPAAGKRTRLTPRKKATQKSPHPVRVVSRTADELQPILKRARASFGYPRLARLKLGILTRGIAEDTALPATKPVRYSFQFASGGRFLERLEGGANALLGHDGKTAWSLSWSNSNVLSPHTGSPALQLVAWVRSGYWLTPGGPLSVQADPTYKETEDEVALQIALPNTRPATLVLDRETALPRRLRVPTRNTSEEWRFSSYDTIAGVQVARIIERFSDEGVFRFKLTELGAAPRMAQDPFAPLRLQAESGHTSGANTPG